MAKQPAAVIGVGQTHHRAQRKDVSMAGLCREAIDRALLDANMTLDDIDAIVVGKAPDLFEGVMMPELFLAEALGAAVIENATIPVTMNVSTEPTTDGEVIRTRLLEQLTSPVRWTGSIRRMIADGATTFVEVGPGVVLTKLVGRIDRTPTSIAIGNLEQVATFNTPA